MRFPRLDPSFFAHTCLGFGQWESGLHVWTCFDLFFIFLGEDPGQRFLSNGRVWLGSDASLASFDAQLSTRIVAAGTSLILVARRVGFWCILYSLVMTRIQTRPVAVLCSPLFYFVCLIECEIGSFSVNFTLVLATNLKRHRVEFIQNGLVQRTTFCFACLFLATVSCVDFFGSLSIQTWLFTRNILYFPD